MKALSELSIGERGIIESILDSELRQKLLEMGCTPGEEICLVRQAPFGGPLAILISSSMLSLSKLDASQIIVKILDE
ncbi:MAG: FeoA family protein [Bacteroidota bacterium]|nr:FeoA family protein [Bacteroidota bacterium]